MTLHALVESNLGAILLLKMLREEQEAASIAIRAAAPTSSLYAAARTLLAVRCEPVALVLDADSTDPAAARRRRQAAEEVVGEAAGAAPFRVLVAVPALEALLFLRPAAVERAFGTRDGDLLALGRLSPRDALQRLNPGEDGATASLKLIGALNDGDVAALRAEPPIRDLLQFRGELRRGGVVAAGIDEP